MCEGFSLDDVLALDAAHIAEFGFVVIGVSGDEDDHSPWAYSVGLLDAADHPELIIAGVDLDASGSLLSILARSVLHDGARFDVGDAIDLGRGVARVGAVHEAQYALDTFNMWHNLERYGAVGLHELEAVQIFLPADLLCSEHLLHQPSLADPKARVGDPVRRLNRAERRRRHPRRRANS
jgi:hypothetical protein